MIEKLQRKLILILMSIVSLILLAVFVAVLLSTSSNNRRMTERILQEALTVQSVPQALQQPKPPKDQTPRKDEPPIPRMTVLVADIAPNGEPNILVNQLYFLEDSEAKLAIQSALDMSATSGILRDFGLRFLKSEQSDRIAMLDSAMEQQMQRNLIRNAALIGTSALALFFLVSLFLSRWAIRPVALAWAQQRQFVADASHELKTPLTVILSNAQMLSRDQSISDEKSARRIDHIQAEALRMRNLTEDLLLLARSDSAEIDIAKQPVDLGFLTMSGILSFEPVIYDERKQLSYDIADSLFVMGDSQRLTQLVHILLDNAVKYCPAGGKITVTLKATNKKTATLTVESEGDLIPSEALEKIFERFYRLDESRSQHGSFGLGLAIAKSITHEHGGGIWAEHTAQAHNRFVLQLPHIGGAETQNFRRIEVFFDTNQQN